MGIFHVNDATNSFPRLVTPGKGKEPRNVFFGGKGGVGKTVCSAATAIWTAGKGYRTLLISADPTRSLAWVLEQKLEPKPTPLKGIKELYVMEIEPGKLIMEQKEAIKERIRSIVGFTLSGIEDYLESSAMSPGTEEEAVFDKFVEYLGCSDYDIVIFDTAPTGYTLRLLSLSKILGKWVDSLIDVRKRALAMRKLVSKAEVSEDVVLSGLMETRERFQIAHGIMADKEKTTFIFVIVSEWTPILEARRAADALSKLGIEVNGIVVNNLLYPEALTHAFFKERRKMQDEYSSLIKEQFARKVIVEVPLLERDIKGITMLRRVANYMFGGESK